MAPYLSEAFTLSNAQSFDAWHRACLHLVRCVAQLVGAERSIAPKRSMGREGNAIRLTQAKQGLAAMLRERSARGSSSTGRRTDVAPGAIDDVMFATLFEEHPLPLWIYDRATLRFLTVNGAACR
ncbi:MAG TPA: hypothetical protein VJQ83_04985, partial [Tepidiformaceae bacterium]|nr:hypothetical protein [Tepidiformaceae bacterium]